MTMPENHMIRMTANRTLGQITERSANLAEDLGLIPSGSRTSSSPSQDIVTWSDQSLLGWVVLEAEDDGSEETDIGENCLDELDQR